MSLSRNRGNLPPGSHYVMLFQWLGIVF